MTQKPTYALGKSPAQRDPRNLLMGALLTKAAPPPAAYDVDDNRPALPVPMFANDTLGCCVISGRAHQTLRFERMEQGRTIAITDEEVKDEYFRQTGGVDSGLVVLDSLRQWRKQGWRAAGQNYKIRAFAEIMPSKTMELKRAICANLGVGIGLELPLSAQRQLERGLPWATTRGQSAAPGSWGGHYVYLVGYTPSGPVCITWGQRQAMSWRFFGRYCSEAYAIFDAPDLSQLPKGINGQAVEAFLLDH